MAEKEEGKETEPQLEPEPTLTPEEQMEALTTQVAEANAAKEKAEALAEEKEKGFKRLQRQLSEKKKATPQVSTSGTARAIQASIDAIEEQAREAGEISPTTQAKLNAARQQLAMMEQQAAYERQDAITDGVIADLRNEFEEAGVDPDSPQCDGVWDSVKIAKMSDGNFDTAKSRASRIIKSAEPKKEEKKAEPESEELDINDPKVQVGLRKLLEKEGKLKTHEGSPSGASGSDAEFKKGLGDGSIPLNKENMERARRLGLSK